MAAKMGSCRRRALMGGMLFSENLPAPGAPYHRWRDRLFAAFDYADWQRAPVRCVRKRCVKRLRSGSLLLEARYDGRSGRCSNLFRLGRNWTSSRTRCTSMAEELERFDEEMGCL